MYIPFKELPPSARVWVYQADRSFSIADEKMIAQVLTDFCSRWEAHGQPLRASFKVEFHQFIILSVDENIAEASGCSIDGSVRTLKELGNQMLIDFFDRTKIAFMFGGKIEIYPLNELGSLFATGQLSSSTRTFNNLTPTQSEWKKNWLTTADKTWLSKFLPKEAVAV